MNKENIIKKLEAERDFHASEIIEIDKQREDYKTKIHSLKLEMTYLEGELSKLNNELVYHEVSKDEMEIAITSINNID